MTESLSIIVPAYNEDARISGSVRRILEYIKEHNLNAELIVVDDGSSDNTTEVTKEVFAKFPDIKTIPIRYDENRGKGFAVKTGLLKANGEIALFSDADLSTPIEELPKLVEPIKNGDYDLTFGSRALDRSLIGERQPWRREQGGKVFNFFVRKMAGLPFWDTQCGFKAFNMKKFHPYLKVMQIERFGFDVEFIYVAYNAGLKLKEIPVRWDNDERTKVRIFQDSLRMFNEVREIRQNAKQGIYG